MQKLYGIIQEMRTWIGFRSFIGDSFLSMIVGKDPSLPSRKDNLYFFILFYFCLQILMLNFDFKTRRKRLTRIYP
jgi:hypothetical protein